MKEGGEGEMKEKITVVLGAFLLGDGGGEGEW